MPGPSRPSADPPRTRDRAATERAIVDAARNAISEEGFQSFRINAIARRANCDKQLIYRYFGGLEGLAEAVGADLAERLAETLEELPGGRRPERYGELMRVLALGFLDLLRQDAIMQRIVAWELVAPSPVLSRLVEARGRRLGAWMHAMRGDLAPPEGIDAPAINAVLIASTQHLVLAAAASGGFAGMTLRSETDWDRVRHALGVLVDGVYR